MNLPNTLTLGRIFLIPLLVVVLLTNFEGRTILGIRKELIGTIIFLLAACTDWLDGFVARRRGQVTELGQLMDPLADKLLITAAFVSLVALDLAPAWMVAIILGRELGVTVLRSIAYSKGITIVASPLGKLKMVSEVVAIVFLILGREYLQEFFVLGQIALGVVLGTALVSALDYYRRFHEKLSLTDEKLAGITERQARNNRSCLSFTNLSFDLCYSPPCPLRINTVLVIIN